MDNHFALVPKRPSAVEKADPGRKRILSRMTDDVLALALARDESAIIPSSEDSAKKWNWEAFRYHVGVGVPENAAKAIEWYRKGTEKGTAFAQRYLGLAYLKGEGVPRDYVEAIKWLRMAAVEPGDAEAQNVLGDCFFCGQGVTADIFEAIKWYRKAADQGLAQAQENLGRCCLMDQGFSLETVGWYIKAAEQGLVTAQFSIGRLYELGQGVPQDNIEAYKFYKLASEQGNEGAKENLNAIAKRMTATEIADGDRRYQKSKEEMRERQLRAMPPSARQSFDTLLAAIENRKKRPKSDQK